MKKKIPCLDKPLSKAKAGDFVIIPRRANLGFKGFGEVLGRVKSGEYRNGIEVRLSKLDIDKKPIIEIIHPKQPGVCIINQKKLLSMGI